MRRKEGVQGLKDCGLSSGRDCNRFNQYVKQIGVFTASSSFVFAAVELAITFHEDHAALDFGIREASVWMTISLLAYSKQLKTSFSTSVIWPPNSRMVVSA